MPGRILAVERCPDLSGLYASSEFLVEKGPTLSSERRIGCLFRFSWQISGMAQFQSRENAGHFGWILQKENDEARHDLSTGARRSALLWLDRRGSQRDRSREIHDSVLPAETKKYLELRKYQTSGRTSEAWSDAIERTRCVQTTAPRKPESLLLRTRRTHDADDYVASFQADKKAWLYFQAQPQGYQRKAIWWVMSAKKEETKLKRLASLIAESERNRRIAAVTGVAA